MLSYSIEGFSAELYLAALSEVAHSDGLNAAEEVFLQQHAEKFGLSLANLPAVPDDLSQLPSSTRVFLYRDALMLAYADGLLSHEEEQHLAHLAQKMSLSEKTVLEIKSWVGDFSDILSRMEKIIEDVK